MIVHLFLTKDENVYFVRKKAAECIEGHCRVSFSWLCRPLCLSGCCNYAQIITPLLNWDGYLRCI